MNRIIKNIISVLAIALVINISSLAAIEPPEGGTPYELQMQDNATPEKYVLSMKFTGNARSESTSIIYRTDKVHMYFDVYFSDGSRDSGQFSLDESALYNILWHDKDIENNIENYYSKSITTIINIPLLDENISGLEGGAITKVDGVEENRQDISYTIEGLTGKTDLFRGMKGVTRIRMEMASEIGALNVPYEDDTQNWIVKNDKVQRYYGESGASGFDMVNEINWTSATENSIREKLRRSLKIDQEVVTEEAKLDVTFGNNRDSNVAVGDTQVVTLIFDERSPSLVDAAAFNIGALGVDKSGANITYLRDRYNSSEGRYELDYQVTFTSTGTYTFNVSGEVTNIKDNTDKLTVPGSFQINVYDPGDIIDPDDVTTIDDVEYSGNISFVPRTSYLISGNRLGWVNHSIPVRVTFDSVPNVREEKDGIDREYQFYLKEGYRVYYEYKDRERKSWEYEYSFDNFMSTDWRAVYDAEQRGIVETENMQSDTTYNIASGDTFTLPSQNSDGIKLELTSNWWNPHPYWDEVSATRFNGYSSESQAENAWEDDVNLDSKEEDEDDDEDYKVSSYGPQYNLKDSEVNEYIEDKYGYTTEKLITEGYDPELDDLFNVTLPNLVYRGDAAVYKIDVTEPTFAIYEHKKSGTSTDFPTQYWTRGRVDINYMLKDDIETIESGIWDDARLSLAGTTQYVEAGGSRIPNDSQGYRTTDLMTLTTGSNVTGIYKLDVDDMEDVARNNVVDPNDWFWIDNDEPTDNMTGDTHLQNVWVNTNVDIGIDLEDRNESGMTSYNFNYRRQYVTGENSKSESNTPYNGSSAPNGNNETTLKEFTWNRTFTEEGVHTITGSAEDAAGNSMSFEHGPFKIDKTAPRIDEFTVIDNEGNLIPNLEFVSDFNNKIRFRASDNLSGVDTNKAVYWFTYYDENDDERRIEDEKGIWRYEFGLNINSRAPGDDLNASRPSDFAEIEINKDITKFINLKSGHINFYYWLQDRAGNIRTNSAICPFGDDPDNPEPDDENDPDDPTDKDPLDDPSDPNNPDKSDGGSSRTPGDDNEGRTYDPDDDGDDDGLEDSSNPDPLDLFKINKLLDLRITDIKDGRWETFFEGTGKYIPVRDMGVYRRNTINSTTTAGKQMGYIGVGYEVDFEIDSVGFEAPADYIDVITTYYAESRSGRIERVDVFVKNGDEYRRIDLFKRYNPQLDNQAGEKVVTQRLTNSEAYRGPREMSTEDTNWSRTWPFKTLVPYDVRLLPYSGGVKETFDQFGADNAIYKSKDYRNLLVGFDIIGTRDGHSDKLYYAEKETDWAYVINDDNTYIPEYGISKTGIRDENAQRWINLDLTGKGIYSGQIFWYKLKQTADDLGFKSGISH